MWVCVNKRYHNEEKKANRIGHCQIMMLRKSRNVQLEFLIFRINLSVKSHEIFSILFTGNECSKAEYTAAALCKINHDPVYHSNQ